MKKQIQRQKDKDSFNSTKKINEHVKRKKANNSLK